ncbi:hypothetical protein [Propionivibrio sp.]|uniref:hypothetical protein n=1 Tax=Propionivibrio sp. TaxID=2212460 RepID=UPI003BF0D3A8
MDKYKQYEKKCDAIRKSNEILLTEFDAWLKSSGLTEKTIDKHLSNIDFYINVYLLYEEAIEAKDGIGSVSMFLGYWFIRKAMASQASIKSSAASIKKFYGFLVEKGLVDKNDLAELEVLIKVQMKEWVRAINRYDSVSDDY